jgi:hypothetical protein
MTTTSKDDPPRSIFDVTIEQRKELFECVGQGITFWAGMEGRLVQVAAELLGSTEAKAGLVLYSINNFHAWNSIIDELFTLDGTYERSSQVWRGLVKSLKAQNDIRVRLAHQLVSSDQTEIAAGSLMFVPR